MQRCARLLLIYLCFFLPYLPAVHAARSTATSFCKCICFNNSTIIALNPPSQSTTANHNNLLFPRDPIAAEDGETKPPSKTHHKLTCADCNRAFCLDHRLPICKDAKEEDVFTTCFQRDSLKDETIVVLFLIITAGLLGWALVQPYIENFRSGRTFRTTESHNQGTYSRNSRAETVRAGSSGSGNQHSAARYSEDDDLR